MQRDLMVWAGGYFALAVLCVLSVLFFGLLTTPAYFKPMECILYCFSGAISAAVLITSEGMWQGIHLNTLMQGAFLDPITVPEIIESPLIVSTTRVVIGASVTAGIALLYWSHARWRNRSDFVSLLKLAVGLCSVALLTTDHLLPAEHLNTIQNGSALLILPFLPLVVIDKPSVPESRLFPRVFVAALAATQFLQAYPVAGSQLSIAAVPLLLWAFICIHDGINGIRRAKSAWTYLANESFTGGIVLFAFAIFMVNSGVWPERYFFSASALRGAAWLHLPPDLENTYEFVASNVGQNCDLLFTLPGMGSLNYWSGVPTPNGLNLTPWMRGLTLKQQQKTLSILQADPKACAVYNEKLAQFWQTTPEDLAELPLAHFIIDVMPKVSERGGYEIHVNPRGRSRWVEASSNWSRKPF
jgi:hypothetical protein